MKEKIIKIYQEKGLNSIYAFLKKENIKYEKIIHIFGLNTNKTAIIEKNNFINLNELKFHYYSISARNKTGYVYNILRAIEIKII